MKFGTEEKQEKSGSRRQEYKKEIKDEEGE